MPDFQIFEYRPRIICPVAIRLALRRTSIVSFLGFPSITALASIFSHHFKHRGPRTIRCFG
jgi:hypothetical protein